MNPDVWPFRFAVVAALAAMVVLLFGITDHEAWTPDEPRETLMSQDMARGSSWVVPQLAGEPFVEKPPLYYWTVASAIRNLPNTLNPAHVARGVSAACGMLILLMLVWFVSSFGSWRSAWLAAAILGTMTGFLELTHWIRIDSVLCAAVTGAAFAGIAGIARGRAVLIVLACFCTGTGISGQGFCGGCVDRSGFHGGGMGEPGPASFELDRLADWVGGDDRTSDVMDSGIFGPRPPRNSGTSGPGSTRLDGFWEKRDISGTSTARFTMLRHWRPCCCLGRRY